MGLGPPPKLARIRDGARELGRVSYVIPSKKPCTDSIREVVGYVWIRMDPHIT